MSARIMFQEVMRRHYGWRPSWYEAPLETKSRWRAYAWCLTEHLDRSWFWRGKEIPSWVPAWALRTEQFD